MTIKHVLATITCFFVITFSVLSHPGRTDSRGGHTNRKTGVYHQHGVSKAKSVPTDKESDLDSVEETDFSTREYKIGKDYAESILRNRKSESEKLSSREILIAQKERELSKREKALEDKERRLLEKERELNLREKSFRNQQSRTNTVNPNLSNSTYYIPHYLNMKDYYHGNIVSPSDIYDGDTIKNVRVKVADLHERGEVWPGVSISDEGVFVKFNLRLSGIDTPESRPRKTWPDGSYRSEASISREKRLSMESREFLKYAIFNKSRGQFWVSNPKLGKYAGRMICKVWIKDYDYNENADSLISVSTLMLGAKLAKPYNGGTRPRWD